MWFCAWRGYLNEQRTAGTRLAANRQVMLPCLMFESPDEFAFQSNYLHFDGFVVLTGTDTMAYCK